MTGGSATARLVLDSRPECVSLVRAMLAGVGERLELDHGLLDDLKTAVSEACNNVVLHAYGSRRGPLSVQLKVGESAVEAAVCDRGGGFRTVVDEARMGLGLPVIGALADRVEFLRVPGGGTEVRMAFADRSAGATSIDRDVDVEPREHWPSSSLNGDVVATVSPVPLLGGILGRLARKLAADAQFSLGRFSDLYLVTDALAEHAQRAASGDQVTFAIGTSTGTLALELAPLLVGSGEQVRGAAVEPEGSASSLLTLADELEARPDGVGEMWRVILRDRAN